ncbi:MAG: hypothetical protein WCD16_04370, partial [Paracoccaceae bacterium]
MRGLGIFVQSCIFVLFVYFFLNPDRQRIGTCSGSGKNMQLGEKPTDADALVDFACVLADLAQP